MRRIWLVSILSLPLLISTHATNADVILNSTDLQWTRRALEAASVSQWRTTSKLVRHIKNPIAKKFLKWKRLCHGPIDTKFSDVDAFLKENPNWPARQRLLRHAERLLSFDMQPKNILQWFNKRKPLSGAGWVHLGLAHIAVGELSKGRKIVQRAWIEGNFSKSDAKTFYRRIRKYLTKADHINRMDRLLWDGKVWAARRLIYKVPNGWKKLAQARYSLRRRTGNVDYLISKVPKDLQRHPGLIYERLRWRRRKGKDTAFNLLKDLPIHLPRPELWWREKAVLARIALKKGRIAQAYNITKSHGLKPGGAAYAEAEWLAGWIALRFLKDHAGALLHFKRMHSAVEYPISLARAAYWAGRAAAIGSDKAAKTWFGRAAAYPLTYYGQLAFGHLSPNGSLPLPTSPWDESSKENNSKFSKNELVAVVKILDEVGEYGSMMHFIRKLYDVSPDPLWRAMTARLARASGRPDIAVRIAKRANRDGTSLLDFAYPILKPPALPKSAQRSAPEAPLTLAVIRQESAFRIDAKSRANARGLMQLIPPTAMRVSKGIKVRYSKKKLMSDPNYNMILGQSYLGSLIEGYKGSYILSLAAYNAGPKRVKRWIKAYGDPRASDIDAIDWIEMIPFTETRNYVQRVLENLQVYRLRLANHKITLGIMSDLHFYEP